MWERIRRKQALEFHPLDDDNDDDDDDDYYYYYYY
jgi:hypothetical protein